MMMGFGGLIVVVWAILVWQIITHNTQQRSETMEKRKVTPQNAREIFAKRYADGEMSRDEFLTAVEDIHTSEEHR